MNQDQKHLTTKNTKESQKIILCFTFSVFRVFRGKKGFCMNNVKRLKT